MFLRENNFYFARDESGGPKIYRVVEMDLQTKSLRVRRDLTLRETTPK
jgi:hypothetical protein